MDLHGKVKNWWLIKWRTMPYPGSTRGSLGDSDAAKRCLRAPWLRLRTHVDPG
jgi:hypothetical protein